MTQESHKISQHVLETIKKDHVTPKPRWHFVLWHALLWVSVGLVVLVGSIGMGLLFEELETTEWDLSYKVSGDFLHWFLLFFPYIWIGILGITLIFAYKTFAATPHGYRYKPWVIIGVAIFCSLAGGIILQYTEVTDVIEIKTQQFLSPYANLQQKRAEIFVAPQYGILGGNIIMVSPSEFILRDTLGRQWVITHKNIAAKSLSFLQRGVRVIAVGYPTSDSTFEAQYVRIWKKQLPHKLSIIFIRKQKE